MSGISLVLTDDNGIRAVNRRYLDHDDTTDVISFYLPPLPGIDAGGAGELIINVEQAFAVRPKAFAQELALYIAHGCDHLMGEEDDDDAGRRRMRRRELRWLRESKEKGLIDGIVTGMANDG